MEEVKTPMRGQDQEFFAAEVTMQNYDHVSFNLNQMKIHTYFPSSTYLPSVLSH